MPIPSVVRGEPRSVLAYLEGFRLLSLSSALVRHRVRDARSKDINVFTIQNATVE